MKTQLLLSARKLSSENLLEYYRMIIKKIGQITDQGYPIPLYLAHQRAHIKKEAANIVLKALGLSEELRGRESIEIL
jgi:NurA-like 5'-3' nuclease